VSELTGAALWWRSEWRRQAEVGSAGAAAACCLLPLPSSDPWLSKGKANRSSDVPG